MINTLTCAYKSGHVIGLALRQLIDAPCVTRVLVADGPHALGPYNTSAFRDEPTVRAVVDGLASDKIVYQHTTDCHSTGEKCNRVLEHVSPDCQWVLVVDSDEVYHEDALARVAEWLASAEYDRYSVSSVNPYPDFYHAFGVPLRTPCLYRWLPGAGCRNGEQDHQWVLHADQRTDPRGDGNLLISRVPDDVCEVYHLNALRSGGRIRPRPDGTVNWCGGGLACNCKIEPLERERIPRSVLRLGRATL